MVRLSDQLIDNVKKDIPLVAWLKDKGHTLKNHGKDFILSCPHHNDDTPSLVISPVTNLWHCMGACQEGGSIIDWVMKTERLGFREAVELLAKELPAGIEPTKITPEVAENTDTFSPLVANKQALLQRVVSFYHDTLKQNPEAIAYLESRGLNDPALIDEFLLGYANRSLLSKLPAKHTRKGKDIRIQLQETGVLRKTGHEHFNGSLVVPVIDWGNFQEKPMVIKELYGRKLGTGLRPGTAYHLYLPGSHEGVWNASALANNDEIILCESLIDAMTFWVNGFKNVTASYGTSGFTDDHLAAFLQHGIKRVLIAYDRDEAGEVAAKKLAKTLQKQAISCFRVNFPKGMDANEYALKVLPANKSLPLVLSKSVFMGEGEAPNITSCNTIEFSAKESDTLPPLAAYPKPNEPLSHVKNILEKQPETVVVDVKEENPEEIDAKIDAKKEEVKSAPSKDDDMEVTDKEVSITFGDRRYRVRGLKKNLSYDQLKINVLVSAGDLCHVDTFDFYSARHRLQFTKQVSLELECDERVIKKDLGKLLLKLETLQEQQIQSTLKPENNAVVLSPEETAQALELLETPDLLSRIVDDFDRAGVVGEETNKLMGYLACVSRKLESPLAIMIQSTSAAGKSSLMDAVLALMPDEEKVQYSAMTGQSLFYMGRTHLKNKILAIAEEEGAHNASYALKLLQSEGEVSIASTGKDQESGNLVTQEYTVEGPVMLMMTTTAIDIDEELLNRCVVLTVNESVEQTQAIHVQQRAKQTLEGMLAKQKQKTILQQHQNAQRLLKSYLVVNPYAEQLTFLSDKTRMRRDHMKYLQLINSIALLHQYQRPIKTTTYEGEVLEYLEVTKADIDCANKIAHEVFGRSLDELPPQTRKLLNLTYQMVTEASKTLSMEMGDYRFSRRLIREYCGWSDGQLKIHCRRLEDMEYFLIHRGSRGCSIEYELLFSGDQSQGKSLSGLINIEKLALDDQKVGQKVQKSGGNVEKAAPSQGQVSPKSGGSQASINEENPNRLVSNDNSTQSSPKIPINGKKYPNPTTHQSKASINTGLLNQHQSSDQEEVLV